MGSGSVVAVESGQRFDYWKQECEESSLEQQAVPWIDELDGDIQREIADPAHDQTYVTG